MKKLLVCFFAFSLTACETIPVSPDDQAIASTPLVCDSKIACDAMWAKTQFWIASNSGYKIQTSSIFLIETFNPTNYSTTWAFRAMREPLGSERERIWIYPNCSSVPACGEKPATVAARFKRYILN